MNNFNLKYIFIIQTVPNDFEKGTSNINVKFENVLNFSSPKGD